MCNSDCERQMPIRNIKPLCPTRWLIHVPAIKATLEQYSPILKTLEDAKANCSPEVSARASSLLARFRDPLTLFGLKMAQDVLSPLDSVNRSLQSPAMTVAGMLQCVKTVKQHLQSKRPNDRFAKLLSEVERQIAEYELDPLTVPRARKPPAHFCGQVQAFHTTSVETHYRIDYVKLIDVAVQQLHDRLLNCPGLARYCQLESTQPLTGQLSDVVCQYPELGEIRSLQTQLDMFLSLPESWWRGTVVERQSLAGEISLSCARPAADG